MSLLFWLLIGVVDAVSGARVVDALVGETTATHAWLQVRVEAAEKESAVIFELSAEEGFPPERTRTLGPVSVQAETGFIARAAAGGLLPGTRYHWRARVKGGTGKGRGGRFQTLPGPDSDAPLSFVVITGMNYHRFHNRYRGDDKALGYPALATITRHEPTFVIFTGDNVYYDTPREGRAKTEAEMRAKWHEQFALPRLRELFAKTSTFWMKDDHDHRFDDSDRTGEKLPGHDLGVRIFREQVPIVAPGDATTPTWRTHRVSRDLQLWFTEGRDHRSPNRDPDGPDKTLWGARQKAWLQKTLLESDARYRVLVSPTPMVGPDDNRKRDNHTNPRGFLHEGTGFLEWVREKKLHENGFLIVCGDRHWQYHSIHPTGVEEFSSGALVDANSRMGRKPGDPKSTDPESRIRQPFTSPRASGGFLHVELRPGEEAPSLRISFQDEHGKVLHTVTR